MTKSSSIPVLSPAAMGRARDVTFSSESNPTSGGKHPQQAKDVRSPPVPALGLSVSNMDDVNNVSNANGDPASMLQPRKSFLLKDVLSQQPTAYVPKYFVERSSLPEERWLRKGGRSKWKPVPNPRAGKPSLQVPGYNPPPADLSWVDVNDDTSSDDDENVNTHTAPDYQLDSMFSRGSPSILGGGHRAFTPLKHFSTSAHSPQLSANGSGGPQTPERCVAAGGGPQVIVSSHNTALMGHLAAATSPNRATPSNVHGRQAFLQRGQGLMSSSPAARPDSRQSVTPTLSLSPPPSVSKKPLTIRGTPMNNGVQDAWSSSYVQLGPFRDLVIYQHDPPGHSIDGIPIDVVPPGNKKLTPLEQHRVEHAQAEFMRVRTPTPHHGHVSKDIARSTHIGLPTATLGHVRHSDDVLAFASSHNSHGAGGGGPRGAPHPAMHFALPSSIVLPLPEPVHAPSQLPPRSPSKLLPPCAHRTSSTQGGEGEGTLGCPECRSVREELESFDAVRESKEERLYQHQLDMWREQQLRDEDSKNVPADMMRTKSGRLVRKLVILDEGPTVAQLYHGTTHEDREALYVSTCGGLSFDISKERFVHLMQKVLAPRIHVRLSDDQAAAMFMAFDVDGNGAVSYFEYLAVLTIQMLSAEQRKFLDDLFHALYRLPFIDSGLDARSASRVMLEHRAQMQLEGELSMSQNGARAPSPMSPALIRRKSSVHMMRRKSTKFFSSSLDAESSFLADDGGGLSVTPHHHGSSIRRKAGIEKLTYLTKAHITLERSRKVVYELKKHNPWFPHPLDDAFADALVHCFKPLQDEDRVNLPKFRMFIFCDDECMPALENLYPKE